MVSWWATMPPWSWWTALRMTMETMVCLFLIIILFLKCNMKIDKVELIPVSVPYKHDEISSRVSRSGITEIIIKITTDNGLVGWGESPRIASAEVILKAIESMIPMMLNQDPWQNQLLEKNVYHDSNWQWSQMTANLAYGGVDMALWDIYGQETGLPIYKLLGGNLREYVDYFYYLQWGMIGEGGFI